jgi:hypothetical protein
MIWRRLADQDQDASYSATIAVGSTSQTFEVALDTGSADLVSLPFTPFETRSSKLILSNETVVIEYRMFPPHL